eukprot:gene12893-27194_t
MDRRNREDEERLNVLKESPEKNSEEIIKLSKQVRDGYKLVILESPSYASTKGIDTILWKQCFYKSIEGYRRNIKKFSVYLEDERKVAFASKGQVTPKYEKAQYLLIQNSSKLQSFLHESSVFYQSLLIEFEKQINKLNINDEDYESILICMHRCLLYLGDLARYRELHADTKTKDKKWTIAKNYYERAAMALPASGNPLNQLAVLSTYVEADCSAMFYYCCCILAEIPFSSGPENLRLLFERASRTYSVNTAMTSRSEVDRSGGNCGNRDRDRGVFEDRRARKPVKVKEFFPMFVCLQGLLYNMISHEKTTSSSNSLYIQNNKNNNNNINTTTTSTSTSIVTFQSLFSIVLEDFDNLLFHMSMPEHVLLEVVVVCIFAVHYSKFSSDSPIESVDNSNESCRLQLESLALTVLFNIVN